MASPLEIRPLSNNLLQNSVIMLSPVAALGVAWSFVDNIAPAQEIMFLAISITTLLLVVLINCINRFCKLTLTEQELIQQRFGKKKVIIYDEIQEVTKRPYNILLIKSKEESVKISLQGISIPEIKLVHDTLEQKVPGGLTECANYKKRISPAALFVLLVFGVTILGTLVAKAISIPTHEDPDKSFLVSATIYKVGMAAIIILFYFIYRHKRSNRDDQ